jgi:uncharacterized protein
MIIKQPFRAVQEKPWYWLVFLLWALVAMPAFAVGTLKIPVSVYTLQGEKKLMLEMAASDDTRRTGLMRRMDLQPCDGMIFLFKSPLNAAFWMKNTPVELDMVFIDAGYSVNHIEHAARPNTLKIRQAKEPVIAMIELAGGCAKASGMRKGDSVRYVLPKGMVIE